MYELTNMWIHRLIPLFFLIFFIVPTCLVLFTFLHKCGTNHQVPYGVVNQLKVISLNSIVIKISITPQIVRNGSRRLNLNLNVSHLPHDHDESHGSLNNGEGTVNSNFDTLLHL